MLNLVRTNSDNKDFQLLTQIFDEYLIEIDGDEKDFFAQYNQIFINNVLICYENEKPIGCGAFKKIDEQTAELKRMFVLPNERGKGIATTILNELEKWIIESGYSSCILETSQKLEKAINLYKRNGYNEIPNYGQYIGVASSLCMKKIF